MKKYLFALLALASLSIVWMCACSSSNDEPANEDEEEDVVEEVVTYYKNPVINRDAPDPTVVRGKDGKFYAFSTMQNGNVPVYQSTNLADWEYYGEAYVPANVPKFVPGAGIWAPDANYIKGKYVLYFSMSTWGGEWEDRKSTRLNSSHIL